MTEEQAERAVDRIIDTISAWEEAETDLYRDNVRPESGTTGRGSSWRRRGGK